MCFQGPIDNQGPVQIRGFVVKSHKNSKPRHLYLKLYDRCEIWQAPRQQCCRCAFQILKRWGNLNYRSRDFETSRDLTMKCFVGYWNGAQNLMNWSIRNSPVVFCCALVTVNSTQILYDYFTVTEVARKTYLILWYNHKKANEYLRIFLGEYHCRHMIFKYSTVVTGLESTLTKDTPYFVIWCFFWIFWSKSITKYRLYIEM